jgi:hypothetical protein
VLEQFCVANNCDEIDQLVFQGFCDQLDDGLVANLPPNVQALRLSGFHDKFSYGLESLKLTSVKKLYLAYVGTFVLSKFCCRSLFKRCY